MDDEMTVQKYEGLTRYLIHENKGQTGAAYLQHGLGKIYHFPDYLVFRYIWTITPPGYMFGH